VKEGPNSPPDLYGIEKFTYVTEENCYLCPAGKSLNYVGINKRNRAHRHYSTVKRCRGCGQKPQCTCGKSSRHRAEWLAKLVEPGVRIRAEHLYQQLDSLQPLRLEARRELLLESRKHAAVKLLRQIPSIGPIRAALLVALLQTPHRFRTKRQLWAYSGFAVEVHDSGEYRWVRGKLQRNRERITVRGLTTQ
jgi:hypothetical protein